MAYKYIQDTWFQMDDTCVNKVGESINPLYSTSLLLYALYSKDESKTMSAMHLNYQMIKIICHFDEGK